MSDKRALIIVDLQPDFLPGGALAVPEGDAVVPVILQLMDSFDIVVATQDWHPAEHGSFAANHEGRSPGEVIDLHGLSQILWPVHCVQGTPGADFVPELRAREAELSAVFRKGQDVKVDSYSGFFDNGKRTDTGLATWLREQGVGEVAVCGLALDYCVKFTAVDALEQGFGVTLIEDATRAVNLAPEDGDKAIAELRERGAKIVSSAAFGQASAQEASA